MPVPTTVLDLDGAQILYDDLRKRAARADGNFADDYQTNQAYAVGDICIYQDKCYQCNTAIAAPGEAWNAAHWTNIKFADYLNESVSDLLSALNHVAQEETAQSIEGLVEQITALVRQIVEEGTGGGDLNGYSLNRGAGNEVILSYTNPEDETETAEAILPTGTTQDEILAEMHTITESLEIWAGGAA